MQRLTVHFWTEVKLGAQEWGVGKRLEKKRGRKRENLYTLPLVHKLVGERIAGLTLHYIRLSRFIGKGNGWDLSWPAQDKRQTKEERKKRRIWDQIHKKWTLKAGHYLWWSWHAWQVNTQTPLAKGEKSRVRYWQKLQWYCIRVFLYIYGSINYHCTLDSAPSLSTAQIMRWRGVVTSFYTLQWQWSLVHMSGRNGGVRCSNTPPPPHSNERWTMSVQDVTCGWWWWVNGMVHWEHECYHEKGKLWGSREFEFYSLINYIKRI